MKFLVSLEEARATLKVMDQSNQRIDSFNTIHRNTAVLEGLDGISDNVVRMRAGLVERAVYHVANRRNGSLLGLELLRLEAGVIAVHGGRGRAG